MTKETVKCLIIGAGPAGYTAAIYAARAGLKPLMYQGPQPGGQLTITNDVENYPGYPNGIKGPQMMMDFQAQAARFGTDIRYGIATKVDFSSYPHKVIIDDSHEIEAYSVIVATGASAKWLGLPAEQKFQNAGVSACAVCDGFFYRNQTVAVVGGGDTACEEASYLAKLCKKVYLLVRTDKMRASKIMQERVLKTENIEILWNSQTLDIVGEQEVEAMRVKNTVSGEVKDFAIKGFFVAIGHQPNTQIFEHILTMDSNGYIITEKGSSRTNIEGVFAAGDAQDHVYRQAVTAAGTGCMAALDAERFLAVKGVH
ncbi:MAG: thioredoxin-disulfide reductase [Thermoflexibacteraceae bacterium]